MNEPVARSRSRFIVGIDLGTTHTVVAYAELGGAPSIFEVPQLVTASEVAARPLLPSLLYARAEGESFADPWAEAPFVVGELARSRGASIPGRLVASAKSWLSHLGVDREAPILPWGADEEASVSRISPLDASATYLSHVRKTWDAAFPADPLASQDVVLTVPASFDQSARELTLRAAERAGLEVHLLEEPQAAFYDFMQGAGASALTALVDALAREALVLVCDVGGGTTDLSLVRVRKTSHPAHPFEVSRTAVGRHLLLGGDNMDLALAHRAEPRLSPQKLDAARFGQLVLACRGAKERLLAEGAPDEVPVTVLSAGSRLVGGALTAKLARTEVVELLVEGFFPQVALEASFQGARAGLVGFGLPYERDVAITRHVAAFLRRQGPDQRTPDAILLNGGVFHARALSERLGDVVESWGSGPVQALPLAHPDVAVARGAVVYGQSLRGRGTRIESNSPRGYYVGLDTPPGERRRLISVVPRGARDGEVHRLADRKFGLLVGRPARFDLFASDDPEVHPPGEVVQLDPDTFLALPPVVVRFDAAEARATEISVEIEGELTEIGTLELSCAEAGRPDGARHRLRFELRKDPESVAAGRDAAGSRESARAPARTRSDVGLRADAVSAIEQVFGRGTKETTPRLVKDLVRELERILGERSTWSARLARAIFDEVTRDPGARRRSADHERVFWMLAGYTIRPGFGDPADPERVARIAPLFAQTLGFPREVRGWQQFFIAFRRAAGGLDEPVQTGIRDLLDPFLAPAEKRAKKRKGLHPEAPDAMLELASWLERVSAARRAELGSWVLERTWTDRDHRLFEAIGRLGARVPTYASVHHVIAPSIVERWIDHLVREKWNELPAAAEAAVRCARLTGDRARDVAEPVRREVETKLTRAGLREEWIHAMREIVPIRESDRAAWFGESLPMGLRLIE